MPFFLQDWSDTDLGSAFVWPVGHPMVLDVSVPAGATKSIRFTTATANSTSYAMTLTLTLPRGADISYWRRVSSEANYDFLRFYIDGVMQASNSGEVAWGLVTFPVTAGTHTFNWTYSKDASASVGSDTAWLALVSVVLGLPVGDLGEIRVAALASIAAHTPAVDMGGMGALGVGPAIMVSVSQPGTLANPYLRSDTATSAVNFTQAISVAAEPVPHTGPAAAPSIWFEFTESQIASLLASTSGFTNGATIELFSGPVNAAPGDLTFIATDGVLPVILGVVAIAALPTLALDSVQTQIINLGLVTMTATVVLAPQRPIDLGAVLLTTVVAVAPQQAVDMGAIALAIGPVVAATPEQFVSLGAVAITVTNAIVISRLSTNIGVVTMATGPVTAIPTLAVPINIGAVTMATGPVNAMVLT